MPLCNILPRQRGQRRVALNYYVLARRASTNHCLSALKQKLWPSTSYLQLDGMNIWLHAVMTVFGQRFNICSPKFVERQ